MNRTLMLLWTFFMLFGTATAQVEPKANLVDEFAKISCDEFQGRTADFFKALANSPQANGYFVIYGPNQLLQGKVLWESEFKSLIKFLAPSLESRIAIVRGRETGELKMQFWTLTGDHLPTELESTAWNFSLPAKTKPFVISSEFSEVCHDDLYPGVVLEYLNANPGLQLHAKIRANTRISRQEGLQKAQIALKTIPPNRVKYLFAKSPGYSIPLVEYWLVPSKSN